MPQTTSRKQAIAVAAVAPADAAVPPGNSDITDLLDQAQGSGYLELYIRSSVTQVIADVRLSLREDGEFAVVAQAGADDRLFAAITLTANTSVKLLVAYAGRPTHAVLSAVPETDVSAWVARVEPA